MRSGSVVTPAQIPSEASIAAGSRAEWKRSEQSAPPLRRLLRGPARATAAVLLVGILASFALLVAIADLNRRTDHRLLELQARQASSVIAASVLSIRDPLATALQTAIASGGNARSFDEYVSHLVGAGRTFISARLVRADGATPMSIASVGVQPDLAPSSAKFDAFVGEAVHATSFVVTPVHSDGKERIAYALADHADPAYIVYAERLIPPDREVSVESNPAFAELDYATYVGAPSAADLATTDVSPRQLPRPGPSVTSDIPFGDTHITLVATARVPLGGTFAADLPWILLLSGLVITGGAAVATGQLSRRNERAVKNAEVAGELYRELTSLYGQQRTIAETLQLALLPSYDPEITGLDIASRYEAGMDGVDVGGDWYSLLALDEHRFCFVVGDVSGRGVSAASVMARIRYTILAYLAEGHAPEVVLSMAANQIDLERDGHFATAIVGVGDVRTGEVRLANAGHLNPLVVSEGRSTIVETKVGVPLGLGGSEYEITEVTLPPGGLIMAFTDGLVERRGEHIDEGFTRLMDASVRPSSSLDALVAQVVATLVQQGSEDDIAILAIRRSA